jgi:hypothetical protein
MRERERERKREEIERYREFPFFLKYNKNTAA